MDRWEMMIRNLETAEVTEQLGRLYGKQPETLRQQRERYAALIRRHGELFGERGDIALISAPGRP